MRKNRNVPLLLAVLVLCGCASVLLPSPTPSLLRPSAYPLTGPVRTVVVDARHGGKDSGASYFGLHEKHLALDIARRLRAKLQAAGLQVVMT
ncbi:MAG: N-acetylmuramoyl-L-alanine amidase, partial [Planctomycetes bacterium]|nr:N-acetylmuramoyl-L-alanine amidase [Planctomycetota bacterium]